MTTTTPERSAEIDSARMRANEARARRAAVRTEIKRAPTYADGLRRCADVVEHAAHDVTAPARAITVERLLTACPWIGGGRVGRVLTRMRPALSPTVLVGHLSVKRADELAQVLRDIADGKRPNPEAA
jgi:hypothetical protein